MSISINNIIKVPSFFRPLGFLKLKNISAGLPSHLYYPHITKKEICCSLSDFLKKKSKIRVFHKSKIIISLQLKYEKGDFKGGESDLLIFINPSSINN